MKYGIITHYDVHNHGAILQLNGLCEVLRHNFGIEVSALKFDKNYDFLGSEMKAKYEISIKSVGIYMKFLADRGLKATLFNYKKRNLLETFKASRCLVGNYYTECGELDGVIVGSDEVFALHTGPTPVFFGHALPSKKIFSYAGCFGPTTINEIERLHCRELVSSGLNSMQGLSMRDQNSIFITKELTGREAKLVCDPVILYGYKKEIAEFDEVNLPPYLLVYAYDTHMNDKTEVEKIKEYARDNNLKIVSPGFYHSWTDYNINVDPVELLRYFKYAQCVVTDTFHGSVMSIITGKEMAVRLRGNTNKLLNLLQEYNLTDRIIDKNCNLTTVFSSKIDQKKLETEVIRRRKDSMSYLSEMVTR